MGKTVKRILTLGKETYVYQDQISEESRQEITILGGAIYEVLQLTIRGFSARTPSLSLSIRYYTEEIMALGDIVKRRFIQRIHQDGRLRNGTSLFTDICYAEEQLIDDCDMVADALIRYGKECGDVTAGKSRADEEKRKQIHELFRDKFEMLDNKQQV